MSKVVLNDVSSLLGNPSSAQATLNSNNEAIEAGFENTISRDGSTPNQMEADFDLNSHRALNMADPEAELDGVNLRSVRPLVQQFAAEIAETIVFETMLEEEFTSLLGQTQFVLAQSPNTLNNTFVFVGGVYQTPGTDYTLSGSDLKTIEFFVGLPAGELVSIRYGLSLPTGITDTANVNYTPPSTLIPGTLKSFLDDLWATGTNKGAKLLRWIQDGVGAIAQTIEEKLRRRVDLHDFLSAAEIADCRTGSPVIDITAKVQAVIDSGIGKLHVPWGDYLMGTVNIDESIVIQGEGNGVDPGSRGTNFILIPDTDGFVADTHNPVTFRDFSMQCALATTAGSGITLKCTTPFLGTVNMFSKIDNVRFENVFIGANITAASSYNVRDCTFWNIPPNGFGTFLNNTFNEDQGDGSVSGCTFGGQDASSLGIGWTGGGGARITDNKFFMAQAAYFDLTQTPGGETAQLIIAHNSFDVPTNPGAASVHPLVLQMVGGVSAFENIVISDNLFIGYFAMKEMLAVMGIGAAKIENLTITGNIFTNPTGSFVGQGMVFLDHANDFVISGNTIIGPGSSNGIAISANCANGAVEGNHIRGFTNNITSSSTSTAVRRRTDSGVTGSVSDGGVITHNLGVTPTKMIISGSVAAQTYTPFTPTATQFQVSVRNTAGASGSAATIYWMVEE